LRAYARNQEAQRELRSGLAAAFAACSDLTGMTFRYPQRARDRPRPSIPLASTLIVLVACQSKGSPPVVGEEVSAEVRARGAALIGELKRSLLGATKAMGQGLPAAISTFATPMRPC
jgi:hypothetical protein